MVQKILISLYTYKPLKASRPSRTKAAENFTIALFFLYNRHFLRQRKQLQRIAVPFFVRITEMTSAWVSFA